MIVTCDACQTRFRIPDEKVTDKGVKVRCTKCQNTFRVTREAPAPPAPALPPAPPPVSDSGFDPFAAFSPSTEPNLDEATRPFTLSPEMMAQLGFDQPPAVPPPAPPRGPPPLPAAPPRPADPFAFLDEVAPPRPPPPQPAHDPFAALDLAPAAPPPAGRPAHDPFASLDLSPAAPPPPARPAHDPFASLDLAPAAPVRPAHDAFALLDTTQPGVPGPTDPFASTQPAFPQEPQPALEDSPPEGTAPGFGELSSPGFGMPSAFSESTQTGIIPNGEPDRGAFDTSGESFDANASTGTFPRPMDRGMFDMPAPPPRSEGLLGDVPPAGDDPGAGTFGADTFGAGGFGPDGMAGGGYGGQEGYGGGGIDPGAGGFGAPGFGEEVTATGVLPAPAPPPPAQPAASPGGSSGPSRSGPSLAAQAALAPEGGGAIRSFGGALVNIAAAVLLLAGLAAVAAVYLNGGRVELAGLSAEHLQHLWAREGDVVTRDVSNGLYDTRGGHAVLFVRGFVENRTGAPGRVKVTAEIYDGDQLLRPASVYAGKSPTPEELADISGQPDVEALMAKLNAAAAEVPPGQKVPFLVPFYEYPTDLSGLRMKVTASAPEPVTAKR